MEHVQKLDGTSAILRFNYKQQRSLFERRSTRIILMIADEDSLFFISLRTESAFHRCLEICAFLLCLLYRISASALFGDLSVSCY